MNDNKKEGIEIKSKRFSSKISLMNLEKKTNAKNLQLIIEDIKDLENNCDKIDKKILKLEEQIDYENPNNYILKELARYHIDKDILADKIEELNEKETTLKLKIWEYDE